MDYFFNYLHNAFKQTKHFPFALLMAWMLIQLSSCANYKEIPYFKNIPSDSGYVYKDGVQIKTATYEEIKIQPNDILNIAIQTIDPDLNATIMGDAPKPTIGVSVSGNNNNIQGYLVDHEGMIELPIAGKIKVGGLTTVEAKEQIRLKALVFYKNPVVNVRIANFKVTVMGEVIRPGAYLINGERATILDALGEAGDMSIFGVRTNVLLSRNENGKQKVVRFDLTSTDIYESPYFYLKQGDVLYIQPSKSKAASTDGAAIRTYAIISSTLSLVVVLATRNY